VNTDRLLAEACRLCQQCPHGPPNRGCGPRHREADNLRSCKPTEFIIFIAQFRVGSPRFMASAQFQVSKETMPCRRSFDNV
jgi:hypothetical protein